MLETAASLPFLPYAGKPGRAPDTRELGIARFPYLILYSVAPAAIESEAAQVAILRVLHEAMQYPRSGRSRSDRLKRPDGEIHLRARLRLVQARVMSRPATGLHAGKAFFDSLSGDG